MTKKRCLQFGLLMAMAMMLVFTVSCAKQGPGPDQPTDEQQVEPDSGEEGQKGAEVGEKEGELGEEDLEQKRRAREKAEQKAEAEKEKEQFVSRNIYFAFDDASLSEQARNRLREKARWLRENTESTVIIEGHCDERGTEEYNLALGSRRAESVKDFLVNAGVDASRLITISYGEEQPAVSGQNPDAWAKNRRVEFRIR
ncbi:MAG: peptidoglycan-associated lipoprotein Pal [Thermodesulfobacteriota bacterium]